ncbi:hypothetical protein ACIOHE_39190 [Streptomyces sp. NPDC087851]|uniref:hypothetical protein n=1 Tax=Streptomyces sp. NPDC087851 TaxID=3365810 RepID=UPI003823A4D7
MVDTPPPAGETLREIAARYGRTYETVRALTKRPGWPAPIGKKGGAHTYDPADVDPIATAAYRRAAPLEPDRLYTARQIAAITSISEGTIRADRAKLRTDGTPRWPAPDGTTRTGANLWYGRTVTAELKKRHSYRRAQRTTPQ